MLLLLLTVGSLRCSSDDATARPAGEPACETEPTTLFERRILPLLADDNPKSCNQCHLTGVDYAAFVRETPCETMACLVADGLVDLDAPAESKLLSWIGRAKPDNELITEQVIEAERAGFLEWIEASASCPSACAGTSCGAPKPARGGCAVEAEPDELAESPADGCSAREIEALFDSDVYAWRGRCFPCHFDNEFEEGLDAPRFIATGGNCATASLQTLRAIEASGYIDLEQADRSLLLLKPLNTPVGGERHGGGRKFNDLEDPAYVSFLRFLDRYNECRSTSN